MERQIREPEAKYVANKIDLPAKAAVAEELERKLGRPMVFGLDGKIVVMVGDKVVEERAYGETTGDEGALNGRETSKMTQK